MLRNEFNLLQFFAVAPGTTTITTVAQRTATGTTQITVTTITVFVFSSTFSFLPEGFSSRIKTACMKSPEFIPVLVISRQTKKTDVPFLIDTGHQIIGELKAYD